MGCYIIKKERDTEIDVYVLRNTYQSTGEYAEHGYIAKHVKKVAYGGYNHPETVVFYYSYNLTVAKIIRRREKQAHKYSV